MKKFITLLLLSAIATCGLFAQKTPTVGAINMERLLQEYVDYQTAFQRVKGAEESAKEYLEDKKKELGLDTVEEDLKALQLEAQNPAASDEARQTAKTKAEQLFKDNQAKIQSIQAMTRQIQQTNSQSSQRELTPYQLKARAAIIQVAKDKSIDLVVQIVPRNVNIKAEDGTETEYSFFDSPVVLYASEQLEITDAVLAVLNSGQ